MDGIHVEVKGMTSTSTNKVANNIKEAGDVELLHNEKMYRIGGK